MTPQPPGDTPTPRTDAATVWRMYAGGPDSEYLDPDFARTLERDLTAALAQVEELRKQLNSESDYQSLHRDEIDAMRRERDEVDRRWRESHQRALANAHIERDTLRRERDAWKTSHDNQVKLRRILTDRPDLQGRAKSMLKLTAERDEARRQLADAKTDLLTAIEDGNRSRQIIYAMSDALSPEPGEHNIDCAKRVAQQRDAAVDVMQIALCRAYSAGYMHGHEATVEGQFFPIHDTDKKDYFSDDIRQMLLDGSQPELAKTLTALKGAK